VEARSRGPWGRDLGEANAKGGSARGPRVTPARGERIHQVRKPSKPRMPHDHQRFGAGRRQHGNGKEGWARREARPATGGGNPSKATKPMNVAGTKQGRQGCGRKEASGGRGSLEAQRSRVRQARCRSLSTASCVGGPKNPTGGPSVAVGVARLGARSRPRRASGQGSHSGRKANGKRGRSVRFGVSIAGVR